MRDGLGGLTTFGRLKAVLLVSAGRLVYTAVVICGLCLFCSAQSSKTDLSEASLEQLGEIRIYSASRHMQLAVDAPSSVTIVTADEIQRYGYRTLADVLATVSGFYVLYDRNYSYVGVQGFARPGDYNSRILLLVDGHRLNDNVYEEAMLGTEFPIDIDLVQRIEIVRGPVSSLYGSNALFAVVNVITRKGRDLDGLELSAAAGSFNSYKGRVSYGAKTDKLEFLVSGTFYGSRGHNSLFFPEYDAPETYSSIASHADDDQLGSALATVSYRDFTLQAIYGTREKGIPTGAWGTVFNDPGTAPPTRTITLICAMPTLLRNGTYWPVSSMTAISTRGPTCFHRRMVALAMYATSILQMESGGALSCSCPRLCGNGTI